MHVPRYIKNVARITTSLGPTEERGFRMWVGYDIAGPAGDYSEEGLIAVDDWTDERLAEHGVSRFTPTTFEALGIRRKS